MSLDLNSIVIALAKEHDTGMLYQDELFEIAEVIINRAWQPHEFICEIGCFIGMTTTYMGRICDIKQTTTKILTIDCFEEYSPEPMNTAGDELKYRENVVKYKQSNRCKLLKGRSVDVAPMVGNNIGFLFIDGSHTYENCKLDMLNYVPKVVRGGIILVDDTWDPYPGVVKATDELMVEPLVKHKMSGSKWKSFVKL